MPANRLFETPTVTASSTVGRSLSCVSCGLHHNVLTPRMFPYGGNKRHIMLIGEGPGEAEDRNAKPFQGRSGNFLKAALRDYGIDLFRDCVSLNAVNCRPPNNRAPSAHEIACCRVVKVNGALQHFAPRLVLLLGGSAVSSVLGAVLPEAQDAAITRWRGFQIPMPDMGAYLCPTFHPSYIMREDKRPEVETVWRQDLRSAFGLLDRAPPVPEDLRSKVSLLKSENDILTTLSNVGQGQLSFDYETTGLRAVMHKLVCVSFCQSPERAFAFMHDASPGPVYEAWRNILLNPSIGKISHNLSFEYEWSRHHFAVDTINWAWDSMLAGHVLDNRTGINGLKLQGFLNFGIVGYDALIAPFLSSSDPRDPASFNGINDFVSRHGEDELLTYCGIDSLLAYRLARLQMDRMNGE